MEAALHKSLLSRCRLFVLPSPRRSIGCVCVCVFMLFNYFKYNQGCHLFILKQLLPSLTAHIESSLHFPCPSCTSNSLFLWVTYSFQFLHSQTLLPLVWHLIFDFNWILTAGNLKNVSLHEKHIKEPNKTTYYRRKKTLFDKNEMQNEEVKKYLNNDWWYRFASMS